MRAGLTWHNRGRCLAGRPTRSPPAPATEELKQQCEPRSLQHAHRRFVGDEFAAAHSASADVAATGRVLVGMLRQFNLDGADWGQIASVCDPGRASWVGQSRHRRWERDVIVLGFGKHNGSPVHELAAGPERGFFRWVVDRPTGHDFPAHVTEICRAALERNGEEFFAWARDGYLLHHREGAK